MTFLNGGALARSSQRELHHRNNSAAELRKPDIEILLDEAPTERELTQVQRWNELASTQAERTRGNARQPGVDEKQHSLIERYPVLGTPKALIVDFGAGIGCASTVFRERGARVVGLEPAPEMAALTREVPIVPYDRIIRYSATGNRELWELPHNPIQPGSVDCIVCYGSFQNFVGKGAAPGEFDEATTLRVLTRMHQLLKPGGKVSIEFLPPQPPVEFHESTTVMNPARFRQLFKEAGFSVITDKPVFAYHHDKLGVDVTYQFIEGTKAGH